jgi:hypothetical protein
VGLREIVYLSVPMLLVQMAQNVTLNPVNVLFARKSVPEERFVITKKRNASVLIIHGERIVPNLLVHLSMVPWHVKHTKCASRVNVSAKEAGGVKIVQHLLLYVILNMITHFPKIKQLPMII